MITIEEDIDHNLDIIEIDTDSNIMLELDVVFIYRALGFVSMKEFDKAHKLYKSLNSVELNVMKLYLDYPRKKNIRNVFKKEMHETHNDVKKMTQ